jgi:hypothetical protein
MKYDSTTRIATKDGSWGGPFAKLYDDGPWTTGGHEPVGNVAGDHKWGIAVFITPPATGSDTYEYGLIDSSQGNGWLWRGANGTFMVAAGATADLTAAGIAMTAFGTTDFKLVVDKAALLAQTLADGGTTSADGGVLGWDTSKVRVKGSGWGWNNVELFDDGTHGDATSGDGKYTFELSQYAGAGKMFPKTGLGSSGDKFEFVWVFGPGDGVEYKDQGGTCPTAGLTAFTKASGGSYASATITVLANKNTAVTIP